jgi:hypothetical protein
MNLFFSVIIAIIILIGGAAALIEIGRRIERTVTGKPEPDTARVIVNVPDGYQPLTPVPSDTTIDGERARLWWTVYEKTLDDSYTDSDDAIEAADAAVDKVFGLSR